MPEPLLQIDQLRVSYPHSDHWAIAGVDLQIAPGERVGLVGESGCGKSTLGRAVMRLLPGEARVSGQITYAGKSVLAMNPEELRCFRGEVVALVFQDPMTRLDPLMTIGDHCLETLRAHQPQLSRAQAKAQAIATLEAVKIPAARWSQYPHEFSGGMRQRVAIALALLLNPRLIVADEPTTSLDVTVSAQILQELTRLCQEREMGLLLISHDLALVGEYCDRMAVMHGGGIVEMGPTQTVLQQPQHPYTRSLLESALHLHASPTPAPDLDQAVPVLRVQNLKRYYNLESKGLSNWFRPTPEQTIKAVDDITLDLYDGEVLGLVGESGCGKSTLSRTLLRLIQPTGGRIEFLGKDLTAMPPKALRQQRRQMQMVFQDPHACLNPMMTVGENITDPLRIHQIADGAAAQEQVLAMLERVGLTPGEEYYQRYPADLSGGQQQRVAIARALITCPRLLICDEPVSMLDATIQAQVLDLMRELKEEFQLTYLFITHDLWVARSFCDRIAVMNAGKIVELGPTQEIFNHPQHPYTQTLLGAAPLLASLG